MSRCTHEGKIAEVAIGEPGFMTHPSPTVFSRKLTSQDGHVQRFLIAPHGNQGWEVREEHDDKVVRRVCYRDWHRVELARTVLDLRASSLRDTGWVES